MLLNLWLLLIELLTEEPPETGYGPMVDPHG